MADTTIQDQINKDLAKKELEKKEKIEVVIHTMPKKFKTSAPESNKAKGIGLLILVGGFIVLVGAFIFLYYYLIKPGSTPSVTKKEEPAAAVEKPVITKEEPEEPATLANEEEEPIVEEEEESKELATSTPEAATSTEEVATSTKKATDAPDADLDGLYDIEELIMGCSPDGGECDNDGYNDADEVANLYDPAAAGAVIADNKNIALYENTEYGYQILHPGIWLVNSIGGQESILFKASNNQFVQVIVQAVEEATSIDEWYLEQFDALSVPPEQVYAKTGWQGVSSEDGLTVYLKHPDVNLVFIVTYNVGLDNTRYYANIFTMMLKSLALSSQSAE